jgi:sigma-B regulation protein RsbU (phosphoserine phosphatase)
MLKRVENGLKIGEMINFNEFIRIELQMARKLQKYLFPDPILNTSGVRIHTWSLPLSDIGGDLYDYHAVRDDLLIFFVADVSGHSISAALYTAIVKMVFHNALQKSQVPGEILTVMNRDLSDPVRRILEYANAGHPQPFWISGNVMGQLQEYDPFLGPIPDTIYRTHTFKIEDSTSLFVYTDGVLDAVGENMISQAGSKMLLRILNADGQSPLEKFIRIQEDITGGEMGVTDDCTLMLVDMI